MWTAARVAGGFFTTEPQREPIFAVTSLKFLLPAQTFSEISLRYVFVDLIPKARGIK